MSFCNSLPAPFLRRPSSSARTADSSPLLASGASSGRALPPVAAVLLALIALLGAPAVVDAQAPLPPVDEILPQEGSEGESTGSPAAEGEESRQAAEGEEGPEGSSAEGGRARLRVGTKHVPPFAIRGEDGSWSGISIELWQDLATELDISYELEEVSLDGMIKGLEDGSLDIAVAAITVTPEREEVIDFTHPFHNAGLGIAVVPDSGWNWMAVFRSFLNKGVLKTVLTLALVLMVVGVLTWLVERRKNAEQFGGSPAHGLGAGFWWAAVTMTTVGYGDKAPVTLGGRLLGLLWMFTGVVMISIFTATMTSSLTVASLGSPIEGASDLPDVRAATLAGSTSEEYLRQNGVRVSTTSTLEEAFELLKDDTVAAVVYDEPILRYQVVQGDSSIRILPEVFRQGDYAFALPQGSPLRERLNRAMLRQLRSSSWRSLLNRYLGE